jgi:hypothetical protein
LIVILSEAKDLKTNNMDGLITVLIIAAAIIFKVVGKNLKSAAGDEVFPHVPFEPEDVPSVEEEKPLFEEAQIALPAKPVQTKPSVRKPEVPILVEEEPQEKEKIDPKKLVIYSEIMKPKYLEETN